MEQKCRLYSIMKSNIKSNPNLVDLNFMPLKPNYNGELNPICISALPKHYLKKLELCIDKEYVIDIVNDKVIKTVNHSIDNKIPITKITYASANICEDEDTEISSKSYSYTSQQEVTLSDGNYIIIDFIDDKKEFEFDDTVHTYILKE